MNKKAIEYILIVEDDSNILELISHHLSRAGYRIRGVKTGEQVLLSVGLEPPDLILLDLMLPGIGGMEVCRQLKKEEKTRSIPIIMLTAKGEEEDIIRGLETGADDYITKPFSSGILLARIQTVLRRNKRRPIKMPPLQIDEQKPMLDRQLVEPRMLGHVVDRVVRPMQRKHHRHALFPRHGARHDKSILPPHPLDVDRAMHDLRPRPQQKSNTNERRDQHANDEQTPRATPLAQLRSQVHA